MAKATNAARAQQLEDERALLLTEARRLPGVAETLEVYEAARIARGTVVTTTTVRTWSTSNRTNAS